MRSHLAFVVSLVVAVVGFGGAAAAQDGPEPVTVAVRELAPFVERDGDDLSGFSVDLMRAIGEEAGVTIELTLVENVAEQLRAVESGAADAAIGVISITSEREERVDFSQPMFNSGIQIAVPEGDGGVALSSLIRSAVSGVLVRLVGLLALGTVVAGALVWLLERHRNPEFARGPWGLFDGMWWATVTALTVGYGDKVPRRRTSRAITMIWMLVGIVTVALLTAEVTATLTVKELGSSIETVGDLVGKDVVTVSGTTSSEFLGRNGIASTGFADVDAAFAEVVRGDADAIVYDSAILRYLVSTPLGSGSVRLAGPVLRPESYGIALPTGSPLVEAMNQALLSLQEDGTYARLVTAYFG